MSNVAVPTPPDVPPASISTSLRDQIHAFKAKLNDFTRNNPLLFFKELKTGTLWLPDAGTPAIAKLLEGSAITLADLGAAGDVQTRAKVRDLHLKAQANAEERGLQTLFVALGFATWALEDAPAKKLADPANEPGAPAKGKPYSAPRDPSAPLVLLPVEIQDANRPGVDPKIARAGDLQINSALLAFVEETYKVRIQEDAGAEDAGEEFNALCSRLQQELRVVPGITFTARCVLGNFNFQKMAMVRDLTEHIELIGENDLIQAISGDLAAQAKLSLAQGERHPVDLDAIPAADELFVLDADSSQQQVLHSILRSETHAVIQGPPGTGKSQTIANLIAALIGSGKRVLFVAEKRAALDAVAKRLTKVGLAHLVLDLHGADVKRKKIYEGLEASDKIARMTPPPDLASTYQQFEEARAQLNAHDRAMHEERPECGQSVYGLMVRLAAIPEAALCDLRFSVGQLQLLTQPEMHKARALFADASTIAPFVLRDPATPWTQADFANDRAAEAAVAVVSTLADRLAEALPQVALLTTKMEIPPCESPSDLDAFADRLATATAVREVFELTLFDLDLEPIVAELRGHQASLVSRALALFDAGARASMRTLRAAGRPGHGGRELFLALEKLLTLPPGWRNATAFGALERIDARALCEKLESVRRETSVLTALAKPSEGLTSLGALQALVATYQRTQTNAYKAVRAHAIREAVVKAGYESILRELERTPRPVALWPDVFEAIWVRSSIEKFSVSDRRLAGFDRERFERIVADFGRLDLGRLELAARRVRRSAAENYFKAQKEHPEQAVALRTNLARKRMQLPLRKLMEKAGDVTMALCPCWMASPLSVSQLTDPRSKFDVVIFDEASQVLPEDAITSIVRGTRVVIAGDKHQLPPTTFFAGAAEDDDGEDDETSVDKSRNIESILDLMSIYVPPQSLEWHYRSLDERLIAFSNKEFYGNSLITFPSREEPPPAMQHYLVDDTKRDGDEDSSSAEVLRVVDLVLEHAQSRPDESLGVIAMGIKHATRIEKTLYETRRGRPDLDAFFSDRGERSFFCKNLERVQGDERDAILLSIGYGKNLKGDMVYRFGPLNNAGGERRLNVAVSRAVRRMTLVSSFRSIDMDDKKCNATGAKVLKRYIRFAESDGRDLGDDQANDKIPMNEFEADIYHALSARGLSLVSQWGTSSYRLDFAVADPRAPGSYCLAIECDGATYHSAQTARDRDRIRQTHLEAQGWKFHRIWSTDWFADRFGETERAVAAYEAAIASEPVVPAQPAAPVVDPAPTVGTKVPALQKPSASEVTDSKQATQAKRAGEKPRMQYGAAIDTYTTRELTDVVRWIVSDGLLRTEEDLLRETARELGYSRLGAKIERTLRSVIVAGKLS